MERIKKLLYSEYRDLSENLLIESPFAETTREGRGLREVALGLTATRLLVAADVINKKNHEFTCPPEVDPSIECFELLSVYPLEFVALSIFRRRKRKTIKARLIDGRLRYYELGGLTERNLSWAMWCDHVRKITARRGRRSSMSETTAASSTSLSTIYGTVTLSGKTEKPIKKNSRSNYWGADGDNRAVKGPLWAQKDLYMGPSYGELGHGYYAPMPIRFAGASLETLRQELRAPKSPKKRIRPIWRRACASWPTSRRPKSAPRRRNVGMCEVLYSREKPKSPPSTFRQAENNSAIALAPKLSRFGFGIGENCNSGLYLRPEIGRRNRPISADAVDRGLEIWEEAVRPKKVAAFRHPRRYGLSGASHFFRAFGPWPVQPGERDSVQRPRAASVVTIRRPPNGAEFRFGVSKRQLTTSVSMTSLDRLQASATRSTTSGSVPVILFWTPDYWYRPRAATSAYRELRRHLEFLRDFQREKTSNLRPKKKFFGGQSSRKNSGGDHCAESAASRQTLEKKSSCRIFGRIFSNRDARQDGAGAEEPRNGGTHQIQRLLRMNLRVTAWDLDSATIARQLTVIDRDLFSRIGVYEISILVREKSALNAANFGAWVAFGHRISCLTASEILAAKKIEMRARILARFVNAAEKCRQMGNLQSCRSIIAGLQSPSIYRLRETWSRLRRRHAMRYELVENLSKLFLPSVSYRPSGDTEETAFLPCVDNLVDLILDEEPLGNDFDRENMIFSSEFKFKINGDASKREKRSVNSEKLPIKRENVARKIMSAAILKFGKKSSCELKKNTKCTNDATWTSREWDLAKKFASHWRERVLKMKIRAADEAKIRKMNSKERKIKKIADWLRKSQQKSRNFDFPMDSLAREFLLKARYREERENFFLSLKLEPP